MATPSAASDRQSFSLDGFPLGSVRSIKDEPYDESRRSGAADNRKTRPRTVDDDNEFWSTYVLAAGESDRQILDTWNKTLDSLLTFAALFSAINTAFIMEAYKRLLPDSSDITNSLLRAMLRRRNDEDSPLTDGEMGFIKWRAPQPAIRVNATLFFSLACSLLASFGAVLGKEMLAQYSSAVALTASASPDQGRTRQRKYDGLENFRFRVLMQMLPALLQLSLVLFLVGLTDFILSLSNEVAAVFVVPIAIGLTAYLYSLFTALHYEDSPFQTSLSSSIRLLRRTLSESETRRRFSKWLSGVRPSLTNASMHLTEHMETIPYLRDNLLEINPQTAPQLSFPLLRRRLQEAMTRLNRSWILDKIRYIFFPFYVCALGMVGWVVQLWDIVILEWKLFDRFHPAEPVDRHNPKDIQSSDCAVWLLRNGHHADVMRKALKAFPLLPADVLLKKQKSAVEPYASIYASSLNRRPGDVEFRWDDPRLKDAITDAIIAGTALFHVLKSRDESALSTSSDLSFQIDPELYDAIDGDQSGQFDFPLATVVVCVQTQMGVTDWNIKLLSRLLSRYLTIVRETKESTMLSTTATGQALLSIPNATTADETSHITIPLPSNASIAGVPMGFHDAPFTAELMPPPIALLLDAVIFCASQRYHWDNYYTVLRRFEEEYEDILGMLHMIAEERSDSMSIASHIALATTAVQWYKRREEEPDSMVFNRVKLSRLRLAWLSIDKRATFFENIGLAFNMVSEHGDSPATIKIYSTLLDITEHFLPKAMDASDKLESHWRQWWPKVVKIIPGLLRFIRQVDRGDYKTIHTALRVIARLLPDDWDLQKTHRSIATYGIPQDLYSLSPLHPNHGVALSVIIASVFSTQYPASPQTRDAAAEVLGWMILFPGVDASLAALINNPTKGIMYNQVTGIPSFLMSMWPATTSPASFSQSKQTDYFERYFSLLLRMRPEEGTLAYAVQMEALTVGMCNFYHFPYAAVTTRENFRKYLPPDITGKTTVLLLWEVLNRMLGGFGYKVWPDDFVKWGITESGRFDDPTLTEEGLAAKEQELKDLRDSKGLSGFEINTVWIGEAMMLLWQKARSIKVVGGYPYFFREDIIKAVLDGFSVAFDRSTNSVKLEVSFHLMKEYLEKVLREHEPDEDLKARMNATLIELDALMYAKQELSPPQVQVQLQPVPHRRVSVQHES